MPKFAHFVEAWRHAERSKREWISPKWRLAVIILTIAGVFWVRDYLQEKYLVEFALTTVPVFLVLDKVMYWFLAGIVVGAAASWLMHEGELAIAIWKALKGFEKKVERSAEKAVGMARERKAVRKKKK